MDRIENIIEEGKLEEIKIIVERKKYDFQHEWKDYCLLQKALKCNQHEIAKYFMEKGFRSHCSFGMKGKTPLEMALDLEYLDIIYEIVLNIEGTFDMAIKQINELLFSAIIEGKINVIDCILSVVDEKKMWSHNDFSQFILFVTCLHNNLNIVRKFFQHSKRSCVCLPTMEQYWHDRLKQKKWPLVSPSLLCFAVTQRNEDLVKLLINYGYNITINDVEENTALHLAHYLNYPVQDTNKFGIIDTILSAHSYTTENPVNIEGISHFHIACSRDNPKIVESFLLLDVDANLQVLGKELKKSTWEKWYPLHIAVKSECKDVVRLLLNYGANLDVVDNLGKFPIDLAHELKNFEILSILENYNFSTNLRKLLPIQKACLSIDWDDVSDLVEGSQAMINDSFDKEHPLCPGCTPMHCLLKSYYPNHLFIKKFFDLGADVTLKDAEGKTALHIALELNLELNLVARYFMNNKEINPVNKYGLSHLHVVSALLRDPQDLSEVIKYFLAKGEDINAAIHDNAQKWPGYSALHLAVTFNNESAVEQLLQHGADLNKKTAKTKETAVEIAGRKFYKMYAGKRFPIDYVEMRMLFLLLKESEIRKLDSFNVHGFSYLHALCIQKGKKSILEVEKLSLDTVQHNINNPVEWHNSLWYKWTPLHISCFFSNYRMISWLLDNGADPLICDHDDNLPLHLFFQHMNNQYSHLAKGNKKSIKGFDERLFGLLQSSYLYSYGDGLAPFHIACFYHEFYDCRSSLIISKYLDRKLYSVNEPIMGEGTMPHNLSDENLNLDKDDTALHIAVKCQCWNLTKLLIFKGADVNRYNNLHLTPFYIMCCTDFNRDKKYEITKIFLEAGAHIEIREPQRKWENMTIFNLMKDASLNLLLYFHAIKIEVLDDVQLEQETFDAVMYYRFIRFEDYEKTRISCVDELNRLKNEGLIDLLYFNNRKMIKLAFNKEFESMIFSTHFSKSYPMYGYLMKVRFHEAKNHRILLEKGKCTLAQATAKWCDLPFLCVDKITNELDRNDLKMLIQAAEILQF